MMNENEKKISPRHRTLKKCIEVLWDSLEAESKAKLENGLDYDLEKLTILTNCNPSSFMETMKSLSGEKVASICEMGFGSLINLQCTELSRPLCQQLVERIDVANHTINIHGRMFQISKSDFEHVMGIKDGGQEIVLNEKLEDARCAEVWKLLCGEEKEISVEYLRKIIIDSEKADDTFKISFALYALSTVLCPSASSKVDQKLIMPLIDHATVCHKNWSTLCFLQLMEGVKDFLKKKEGYVGGSVLFLQLFYCELVSKRLNHVEKCVLPIVAWGNKETKRLVKWVVNHGGLNCSLIFDYNEIFAKRGEDIDIGKNVQKQVMNKIESVKSDTGNTVGETLQKLEKQIEVMKEQMIPNIVAEVAKLMSKPEAHQVMNEKVIMEVGANVVHIIESEGGNDVKCQDPSELDSLIVVGTRMGNPPQAPVIHRPEVRLNRGKGGNGSQRSDCSRSPLGNGGTVMKNNLAPTKTQAPVRVLFPQSNNNVDTKCKKQKPKIPDVGRLHAASGISAMDEEILNFLFPASQLTADESSYMVAGCDGFLINRGDIACLQPQTPLLDDVINVMAAYMYERHSLSWFFPTHFGQLAQNNVGNLTYDQWVEYTRSTCRLDRFQGTSIGASKIFIPLHDGNFNHWFLLIVNTRYRQAVLYDSLPTDESTDSRRVIAKTVLRHLDRVFANDIMHMELVHLDQWFEFRHFTLINGAFNPIQDNTCDCGIYVIRHMQNGGSTWRFGFNSADQRVKLALELVKHPKNTDQAYVFNNMRCIRPRVLASGRVGDGDMCTDTSGSMKTPKSNNAKKKVTGNRKRAAGNVENGRLNPSKVRCMPRRR